MAIKSQDPLESKEPKTEEETQANDLSEEVVNEEPDEEEDFLCSIENVKSETTDSNAQNNEPEAAPALLKEALKKGEVKHESCGDAKVTESENAKISGVDSIVEEKKEEQPNTVNARVNQLDFLLSKASEYSNFIANDLQELQSALTNDARRKAASIEKSGKKSKKRKGRDSSLSSKKSKKNSGESNLKEAQEKHALNIGTKPIFIQPPNLAAGCKLKDYQLEGVRWLTSLFENGVSGILADEMGLGKTIQVIAMIAHLRSMNVPGPFLVVAPLATLPNWVREIEKWLPSVSVVRFHGNAKEREYFLETSMNRKKARSPDFPIIVTSYEVAIREEKKLDKIGGYTYLVVDEGQRLKNHRCLLIRSLKRIRAANRLLLSGTPIQNNLDELWSLLNFVNPAIFDDLSVFQSWFGFRDIGQKGATATNTESIIMEERKNLTVTKLHEILRPFLLRRIKKDVLTDMPPKKEIVVYAGMSKLQLGYADLIDKNVLRDILVRQGIEQGRTLSQTNKMMNHRKNANHPFLFGEPIDGATGQHVGSAHPQLLVRASGKFALLDRMLERLFKDKHQVLIFSQMTRVLNILEDYLIWRNWKYCRIDGNTKIDERQRQMDVFNAEKTAGADGSRNDDDDRHFVFMLSTRAGGLGINLASADTCIIFDSDWNPHQDSQAMDRCHRIGQNRPVAVYRLLTANSVDIDMMEKQISKKKLERMAIAGGDFRKAGSRSTGEFSFKKLSDLLEDDIKDLHAKGGDIESIKIDDGEFDAIMSREKLFAEGNAAIPTEGRMYDIVDANKGEVLGAFS
eukprot:CAMPEP_0184863292 /NCGR_PEP_ID=MMETSP0580-20130426/10487_1 /TAXON_ID=1118495 /ORGANISM="Dactyliosolen fragilissimus" /LENGTH=797 /DNA_ID=CAMNT_0027361547 /DNA_START=180 /DNA_END=2573 /DNA_ORIENTATION=+